MIDRKNVEGGSDYFKKDDYYAKEAGILEGIKINDKETGVWTYGEDTLKERFGVDLSSVKATKMFDQLVKAGVGSNESVGHDFTFSAPKDVSLLFAFGNDEIKQIAYEAHRQAVEKTLQYINNNLIRVRETHNGETIQTRGTGITTIAFDHFLSREKDPQLHTHVVVLNQAKRLTDGKIVAINFYHEDGVLNNKEVGKVDVLYTSELAKALKEHGIAIEWDKQGRYFTIKGITEEQRQAFSTRQQQIDEYCREHGLDPNNPKDREIAALATRKSKERVNLDELKRQWQEKAKEVNLDVNKVVAENRLSKDEIQSMIANYEINAESDVARQVINDMHGVFSKTEFLALAAQFAHQAGREFSLEKSEKELQKLIEIGAVKELGEVAGIEQYVTKQFLEAEKYLINSIDKKLNQGGFVSKEQFKQDMQEFIEKFKQENGFWLNKEQEKALKMIFTSGNVYNAIQGYAGVGKSALFKAANEYGRYLGEKYGADKAVHFVGISPTGQAMKVLEESSGIKSTTIHSFLANQSKAVYINRTVITKQGHIEKIKLNAKTKQRENLTGRTVIVLDEAGMADSHIMKQVFEQVNKANALDKNNNVKLVMSGDINQFQSVGAGKAFAMLQRKGLETTKITQIIRQKDPVIREALKQYADGNSSKLKQEMEKRGWIHEVEDKDQMKNAIFDKYKQLLEKANGDPGKIMILAQTNKTVDALNEAIRNYLKQNGKISFTETAHIRVVKDRSNTYTAKDYKKIDNKAKQEFMKNNEIAGTKFIGQTTIVQKNFIGTTIYSLNDKQQEQSKQFVVGEKLEAVKEFAKGDRIVFLTNDKKLDVQNGLQGTITKIDIQHNTMTVKTDNGKEIVVNWTKYNHFDYAYALTEHKSQGATVDHAIVIHEGNATKNAIYVACTRAKEETHIFTENKDKLFKEMEIKQENRSALELLEQKEKEEQIKSSSKEKAEIKQDNHEQYKAEKQKPRQDNSKQETQAESRIERLEQAQESMRNIEQRELERQEAQEQSRQQEQQQEQGGYEISR